MASNFDFNAVVNIVSNGVGNLTAGAQGLRNLAKSATGVGEALKRLKIIEFDPKLQSSLTQATKSLTTTQKLVEKLGNSKDFANFAKNGQAAVDILVDYERQLKNVQTFATATKNVVLYKNAAQSRNELQALRRVMNDVLRTGEAVNAQNIHLNLRTDLEARLKSTAKQLSDFKKQVTEVEKTGNIDLKVKLDIQQGQLEKELDGINKGIQTIGDRSALSLRTKAAAQFKGLADDSARLSTLTAEGKAIKDRTVAEFKELESVAQRKAAIKSLRGEYLELQKLLKNTDTTSKIDIQINTAAAREQISALQAKIDATRHIVDTTLNGSERQGLLKQLAALEQEFNNAKQTAAQFGQVLRDNAVLEERNAALFQTLKNKAGRKGALAEAKKELTDVSKLFDKLDKEAANTVDIKIALHNGGKILNDAIAKVELLKKTALSSTSGKEKVTLLKGVAEAQEHIGRLTGRISEYNRVLSSKNSNIFAAAIQNSIGHIRNFEKAVGKSGGFLKAFAGSFRLAGNAAFVFGGHLRGLGFLLNAFGSFFQNFAPLFYQLITTAGPVGVAVVALGTAFVAATAAGLGFSAVLGFVAAKGLAIQGEFDKTAIAVAANVAEFFNIEKAVDSAGKAYTKVTDPVESFAAAQQLAREQVTALATESITSLFTTSELYDAFRSLNTAAAGLNPSLEKARELTGAFSRVASVGAVSTKDLSTGINLVLRGQGRAGTRLQQILNGLKDSKGIELTRNRIKQLRAEGGNVLFDELTNALNRFSQASGEAASSTLPGIISNFTDLFEQIARLGSVGLYERLTGNVSRFFVNAKGEVERGADEIEAITLKKLITLNSIFEKFIVRPDFIDKNNKKVKLADGSFKKSESGIQADDVNTTQIESFTQPVNDLITSLNELLSTVAPDILKFLNYIAEVILNLGPKIKDNLANFDGIWQSTLSILDTLVGIGGELGHILGYSGNLNDDLQHTVTILDAIRYVINAVRLIMSASLTIASAIPIALGGMLRVLEWSINALEYFRNLLSTILHSIPLVGDALGGVFDKLAGSGKISNPFTDLSKGVLDFGKDVASSLPKTYNNIQEESLRHDRRMQAIQQRQFKRDNPGLAGQNQGSAKQGPATGAKDPYFKNQETQAALAEKFSKAKYRAIGKNEKAEDTAAKGRQNARVASTIESQKKLTDDIIKLAVQTEEAQLAAVKDYISKQQTLLKDSLDLNLISQQEYNDQIKRLREKELAEELKSKENAREVTRLEALSSEEKFFSRAKELRDQFNKTAANKRQPQQLANDLANLQNQLDDARIKKVTDVKKIENEIEAIKRKQLEITQGIIVEQAKLSIQLRKDLEAAKLSIADATGDNSSRGLKLKLDNIVAESLDKLRAYTQSQEALLSKTNRSPAEEYQLSIYKELIPATKEEISLRQELFKYDKLNEYLSTQKEEASFKEERINKQLANGTISKYQAEVQLTAARKESAYVLERTIDLLEQEAIKIGDPKKILEIRKLRAEIQDLGQDITENITLKFNKDVYDSISTFFDKIADGTTGAKAAFADLAKSILGSFRKIIADQITKQFFSFLNPEQTEGKAKGPFAEFFRRIGVETAPKQSKEADIIAKTRAGQAPSLKELKERFGLKDTKEEDLKNLDSTFKKLNAVVDAETKALADSLAAYRETIQKGQEPSVRVLNPEDAEKTVLDVLNTEPNIDTSVKGAISPATGRQAIISKLKASARYGTLGGKNTSTGSTLLDEIIGSKVSATEAVGLPAPNVTSKSTVSRVVSVVVDNFAQLTPLLTDLINGFTVNLDNEFKAILDAIRASTDDIVTAIGKISASSGQSADALSGLSDSLGGLFGKPSGSGDVGNGVDLSDYGFAKGGSVKRKGLVRGKGTGRSDSILARLSNGEYVVRESAVKKLGVNFLDHINGYADGGYVRPAINTDKFDYSKGGASVLTKALPAAIKEQPPKKRGGFLGILGSILGFVAPFLNLIPGVGPFLAVGAGALGGVLSGAASGGLKGALLGGITGGLGNLGGFAGSSGTLGQIGKFFSSSGSGGQILNLLGSVGIGNGVSVPINGKNLNTSTILKNIAKVAVPNIVAGGSSPTPYKPPGFASGGLVSGIQGILGKLGGGKSGSLGSTVNLLSMFGSISKIASLFGSSSSQDQYEPDIDDPDAARKNFYGSAYNTLGDLGVIPRFEYLPDTLQRLWEQQNGIKRKVKKTGFFAKLFSLIPAIANIASLFFGGKPKLPLGVSSLANSPGVKNLDDILAGGSGYKPLDFLGAGVIKPTGGGLNIKTKFASGGMFKGSGTGTSDSILARVSNGEFIFPADVVKNIGAGTLYNIMNAAKFAQGGLVGASIDTLPEKRDNNISVDGSTHIINVLDHKLVENYLATPAGRKAIINVIGNEKSSVKQVLK